METFDKRDLDFIWHWLEQYQLCLSSAPTAQERIADRSGCRGCQNVTRRFLEDPGEAITRFGNLREAWERYKEGGA